MQELRISSGYHRGATLPLEQDTLTIGAGEDADVVLADPGLAVLHARLQVAAPGAWNLVAVDGEVRDAESNTSLAELELRSGDFARVGAIWLTVAEAGAAWQDPPPVPVDVPEPAPQPEPEAAAQEDTEPGRDGESDADGVDELDAEAQDAPPPGAAVAASEPIRPRGLHLVLAVVGSVMVLSGAAAYALTGRPAGAGEQPAAQAAQQVRKLAAPVRLPAEQLQDALRKRLGEIDLLGRVTLELQAGEWTIRGALNDDESQRLQRMLQNFAERYVIDFPVNVKIGSAESMLPFRIIQVISGNDPSIVTDDGRRLYVGDEYRGVRLVAMAGNQLRFTGKHDLNVSW